MASVVPLDCRDGRGGLKAWCVQLSSVVGGSCSGEMWKCGGANVATCAGSDHCGCGEAMGDCRGDSVGDGAGLRAWCVQLRSVVGRSCFGEMWDWGVVKATA